MKSLAATVLVACLFQEAAAEAPDPNVGSYQSAGAGLAFVSVTNSSTKPGLELEGRFGYRFSRTFGMTGILNWSFTEPERTRELFDKGVDLGRGTTDAIRSITNWVKDCSDETKVLCGFGAFFAYVVVGFFGYAGAGFAILGSPFAATSQVGVTVAGTYFFGERRKGGFGEAGISGMTLFLRDYDKPTGALGFVIGVGAQLGAFTIGGRLIFAPAVLQREAGTNHDVAITMLTLSYGR